MRLARFGPALVFLLVTCLFLWRIVFAGQVLVPATLLHYLAPWQQEARPPWNPLMYDSVGQFYPWRSFAAESIRGGRIPLWNPYQFCGTPFIANSQSAVFYPGNLLFYALPTPYAFGVSAVLHLLLAAGFTYLLLRNFGLCRTPAVFGGIAFAFSTWQASWLELPTFLCTSCWLPLILLLVRRLIKMPSFPRTIGLGFTIGACLLGGHLQIGFYVILAAGLFAGYTIIDQRRMTTDQQGVVVVVRRWSSAGILAASLALGLALSAAQIIPALELSKRSHRAIPVSAQGYEAYTGYAPAYRSLVTLFLPDFYNNPSDPDAAYFGTSSAGMLFNYAEGALYVGMPTLLLAGYALVRRRQSAHTLPFFGMLALLSLLMAFGTPLDRLFYFLVPGFGQSGSPGRALLLWAFALAILAAFGYDKLLNDEASPVRTAAGTVAAMAALAVILTSLAIGPAQETMQALGINRTQWHPRIAQQALLFALSGACLVGLATHRLRNGWRAALPIGLLVADLFATGGAYNITAEPADVYPSTTLITTVRQLAGHDRIMPINDNWSFLGPRAVLPPNGAMVFGLHDVQGYDSLFPGQYKAFMNTLSGQDASPREVGNMVFAKNAASPMAAKAGVRFVLARAPLMMGGALTPMDEVYPYEILNAPGRAHGETDDGRRMTVGWLEDSASHVRLSVDAPSDGWLTLADEVYPGWHAAMDGKSIRIERVDGVFRRVRLSAGKHTVSFEYRPAGFHLGLYLALAAVGLGAFALALQGMLRPVR